MKSFLNWMSKNIALSFLMFVQVFSLVLVLGYTVTSFLFHSKEPDVSTTLSKERLVIITETVQQDLVKTELETFDSNQWVSGNIKMIVLPRKEAIDEFVKNNNTLLILSEPIGKKDISFLKLEPQRLPLKQETIVGSEGISVPSFVLIRNKVSSAEETKLATFLNKRENQDLVFKKWTHQSNKNTFKKG